MVTYTTVFHFVEFVGSIRWLDLDHDEYYMQSIITNINSTCHDLVGWDLLPETILNTSALPSDSEVQRCAMRISLHLLGKKKTCANWDDKMALLNLKLQFRMSYKIWIVMRWAVCKGRTDVFWHDTSLVLSFIFDPRVLRSWFNSRIWATRSQT